MAPTMSTAYTHGHTAVTRALALAPPRRQDMPAAARAERQHRRREAILGISRMTTCTFPGEAAIREGSFVCGKQLERCQRLMEQVWRARRSRRQYVLRRHLASCGALQERSILPSYCRTTCWRSFVVFAVACHAERRSYCCRRRHWCRLHHGRQNWCIRRRPVRHFAKCLRRRGSHQSFR